MKSILDPSFRYTTQRLYSGAKRKALANWNSETVQPAHEREACFVVSSCEWLDVCLRSPRRNRLALRGQFRGGRGQMRTWKQTLVLLSAWLKITRWLIVLSALCVATVPARSAVIPGLFNTGVVTETPIVLEADGTVDLHYVLVASADPSFPGPDSWVAVVARPCPDALPCWLADGPDSKWISSRPDTWTAPGVGGNYDYRLIFDLTGFNPSTASITGQWATDNGGGPIKVNGAATAFTTGDLDFDHFTPFTISSGFVAGLNTLDFPVVNGPFTFTGNPTGLRVEFLSATASAVPEPTTLMLLTLGLAGLPASRRRKLN
jgi:PEP-CTERM motif